MTCLAAISNIYFFYQRGCLVLFSLYIILILCALQHTYVEYTENLIMLSLQTRTLYMFESYIQCTTGNAYHFIPYYMPHFILLEKSKENEWIAGRLQWDSNQLQAKQNPFGNPRGTFRAFSEPFTIGGIFLSH